MIQLSRHSSRLVLPDYVRTQRGRKPVSHPLLNNLIGYWNLDEASGNRADSHTNGLTLTDNNTVTSQATGGPDGGQCAQFTRANSEYLSRASESLLQTGDIDFTIAAWVYFDSTTNGQAVVAKGDVTTGEYSLFSNPASGIFFTVDAANHLANGGTPGTAAWHFIVAWHDATANTINCQMDDGSAGSNAEGTVQAASTNAFNIGNDAGSRYMDGRMAYVGLWKRVLTSGEKTFLYNSGSGRTYAAVAAYTG